MTVEEIVAALKAIVDGAEGREMSDEEMERYEELEGKLAVAKRSAEVRSRHNAYLTPVATETATMGGEKVNFRSALTSYVKTGNAEPLAQYRAQSEGIGSAGGYTVPDDFRTKIVEKMVTFGGFAAEAEVINSSDGRDTTWTTLDDSTNLGEIVFENDTFVSGADLVFGQGQIVVYKYMAGGAGALPLKVSVELLQDSAFDFEALVADKLGTRIGRMQAVHFLTGDGAGEPLGLLTPKTAYDEIASNTAGPSVAELVATIHAVDPAYRSNAKWLMNDATLAVMRSQLDGNDRPLWAPANDGLAGSLPGGTLLGYPVIIDQAMPSIGDQTKFLAFGDFKQAYVIKRAKDITLVPLRERYAEYGQVGFFVWSRAGGTVQDTNAYVVLAGQNV